MFRIVNRKIKIVEYAYKTRQLFLRIYALVEFIKTAHINVSVFKSFQKKFTFPFIRLNGYRLFVSEHFVVLRSTSVHIYRYGRFPLRFGQKQTSQCQITELLNFNVSGRDHSWHVSKTTSLHQSNS